MGSLVPVRQAAYAVCAMFLGIELMNRLAPERSEAEEVFDMMGRMAELVQDLLPALVMEQF